MEPESTDRWCSCRCKRSLAPTMDRWRATRTPYNCQSMLCGVVRKKGEFICMHACMHGEIICMHVCDGDVFFVLRPRLDDRCTAHKASSQGVQQSSNEMGRRQHRHRRIIVQPIIHGYLRVGILVVVNNLDHCCCVGAAYSSTCIQRRSSADPAPTAKTQKTKNGRNKC